MKIHLMQCSKQRCGHVLLDTERVWVPKDKWIDVGGTVAICPKCGGDSFYTLNEKGQTRKGGDTSTREIDHDSIAPSPRMGLKMKRRLLAAKRRAEALEAL